MKNVLLFFIAFSVFGCHAAIETEISSLESIQETDAYKRLVQVNDQIFDMVLNQEFRYNDFQVLIDSNIKEDPDLSICTLKDKEIETLAGAIRYRALLCEKTDLIIQVFSENSMNENPVMMKKVLDSISSDEYILN